MPSALRSKFEQPICDALAAPFERDLLRAAFDNLDVGGPLSVNNFSYALRELLRHVLHRRAPNDKVRACSWFKPDLTAQDGITRAHRATYAIQGGLSDPFVTKKLKIDVPSARRDLLRAIDSLSKYTHIEESTLGIKKKEADRIAGECLEAVRYFLDRIVECRTEVIEALAESIDHHLIDHVISETIDSIDELATHHRIDEISVDDIEVREIGPDSIKLAVEGSVGVELQYGSNSDVENDIGAVMSDSFPLRAELTVKMVRPLGKEASVDSFMVDTRSWYE